MRCLSCLENVCEARALEISSDTVRRIVDVELADDEYEVEAIRGLLFHLRYVEGVLPPGPETSPLHSGPVICGPLDAAVFPGAVRLEGGPDA